MRTITARKMQVQEMIEVTGEQFKVIYDLNPWIGLNQYDEAHSDFNTNEIVGYIAGDINMLQMHEKDMKITDSSVHDCWFVNKAFFDENYMEVEA